MDKQDLITVIVTTYNSLNYLRRTLYSVLEQTYRNLELLVLDDHSTNPLTLELLNEYAARDPRVRLVCNNENQGVSYGRNLGVELAQGKYFIFLDHDGYLNKNCIERLHAASVAHQLGLTLCHIESFAAPQVNIKFTHNYLYIPKGWISLAEPVTHPALPEQAACPNLAERAALPGLEDAKSAAILPTNIATAPTSYQAATATLSTASTAAVPTDTPIPPANQSTTKLGAMDKAGTLLTDEQWANCGSYILKREDLIYNPIFMRTPSTPIDKFFETESYRACDLQFRECYAI